MKHTLSFFALAPAALTLAAVALLPAPAAAKTRHSHKRHTKAHTKTHTKMHKKMPAMTHVKAPGASSALTPAPGTIGPARTGTGPSPTTGRVLGVVPNAVGDAGGQVNPPGAPAGGGVSR